MFYCRFVGLFWINGESGALLSGKGHVRSDHGLEVFEGADNGAILLWLFAGFAVNFAM